MPHKCPDTYGLLNNLLAGCDGCGLVVAGVRVEPDAGILVAERLIVTQFTGDGYRLAVFVASEDLLVAQGERLDRPQFNALGEVRYARFGGQC